MLQFSSGFGQDPSEPWGDTAVAIVGMACRFAGARSVDDYWTNLCGGVESITRYTDEELIAAGVDPKLLAHPHYVKAGAPLADMECFDATLFGLSPRDAAIMDPQHRHFLECAWEAMENAGHTPERFAGAIGVFAGSGHNSYMPSNLLGHPKLLRDVGLFLLRHTGNDKDFLTTRVSYLLNLKGPSINVQTACSTSLVATHMAIQSLLSNECDMALAGGASIELPHRQGYLHEEGGILSPDGHCRPFDAKSRGTVFGSGVGVVVLRRLRDAMESGDHIYAVIRGSAINNDGASKVGYLAPSVDGQAHAITEALGIADVDASTIGYVEAHGTGTPVGDPIEIAALTQAFRKDGAEVGYCGIGSVKANIGHTDTAAGVASLIKVALSLHHGQLPPSLNFTGANPNAGLAGSPFVVNDTLRPWARLGAQPLRAGVSSLGVGGTNAHAVLEEAPRRSAGDPSRPHQLFALSARSAVALEANTAALAEHLAAHAHDLNFADVAYTMSVGRQTLNRRRVVVAESTDEAAAALADPARAFTADAISDRPVAFLFCGAGSQYAAMGAGLYRTEPVYRAALNASIDHMKRIAGIDLKAVLLPAPEDEERARQMLERPTIALPALFAVQVALARLWMSWGVRPGGMIGHSSGEYAAAHLAGVFSLEDALRIVHTRGRLFESLPEGAMLSVPMEETALRAMLPSELAIAAINGPKLCVVSGPAEAIHGFGEALAGQGVESRRVPISVAAHSPMLDGVLGEFRAMLRTVPMKAPGLAFVSNLSGDWITAAEATDPDYWVRHLRETVRFTDGLARLLEEPHQVLLEVGPGRTMASFARQHGARSAGQPVLSSLRHPDEQVADTAFLLGALGQLWALGVEINWGRYWIEEKRLRLPLPTYRFDRERHWIDARAPLPQEDDEGETPERRADMKDWFYEPVWQRTELPEYQTGTSAALIFEDGIGLGDAIARRLRAAGRAAILVRAGRRYRCEATDRFTIDPRNPAHYAALLATLADKGRLPGQIYHLWLATGTQGSSVERMQERGFDSLLYLAQALAQHDFGVPVEIAVVSDGIQRVCDEGMLTPAKATVLGPCRVIAREYPHLHVRSVDFAVQRWSDAGRSRIADALIAELASPDGAEMIAYRAGERWSQSFVPAPGRAEGVIRLRRQGVYLITGGLGGLGLALARHLAETQGARLALVGRTALPPRERWERRLAELSPADPLGRRLREMMAIEAAGGEVLPIAADVTDVRAMQRAVRQVRRHFGAIDGVFHAAGLLDDGPIQLKQHDAARAVIAPKLLGTLALEQALRVEKPEFLVLFSSVSAIAGLGGQVDYAGANAFLDAYAQARRSDERTRVVSIGWSQWQEIGMAAALTGSVTPLEHPLLETLHILSDDERFAQTTLSPDTHWLLDEHRLADGSALVPGAGHLELVRAAFATIADGPVELSDVTFLSPCAVADGARRAVRVHFRRRTENGWSFSIVGEQVGDWIEHVRGQIAPASPPSTATFTPMAPGKEVAVAMVEQSPHLRFGRHWQTVHRVEVGEGEALLHLALAPEFRAEVEELALHPALLDFATAGAQMLVPGRDAARDFFAPASYDRVRVRATLAERIVSHIRYRPGADGAETLATFDIVIMDEAGAILVEVEGFTMMKVRTTSLLVPGEVAMVDRSAMAGLLPKEGLHALERILGGANSAHVIVSPQPLDAAIRWLRRPPRAAARVGRAPADGDDADLPATEAECMIAGLWSEMFGVGQVLRTDGFFDLGGHSLLAVQFTNRLRKMTGRRLALSALLDNPTVERLAAILDPDSAPVAAKATDAPAGVVTIRAGGDRPPLFLIHDGLGETLLYRGLAMRLDAGHPVYGLEPERRTDGSFEHSRIDEMAAAYVARIQRIRPHGPYLLAGLCAGGVIAFEVGRQLQDKGETVAFIGIMDAADVHASKRRLHATQSRLERVRALLGGTGGLGVVPVLLRKLGNFVVWEVRSRMEKRHRLRIVDDMRKAESGVAGLPFLQLYELAHEAHHPQGLFAGGDVALFRATTGNGAPEDIPFMEVYSDCILGWGRRVADEVELVPVPGGHTSLLQEPHVATLSALLQRRLNESLARWASDEGASAQFDAKPALVPAEVQ